MPQYVGQEKGGVSPINKVEESYPELLFSEKDSKEFWRLNGDLENPVITFELLDRLVEQANNLNSHRAQFLLNVLLFKAKVQGQVGSTEVVKSDIVNTQHNLWEPEAWKAFAPREEIQ
jgi:hypothetical protein